MYRHLDIVETDYFGLQYTDEKGVTRWIDTHKTIKKQTAKQKGNTYTCRWRSSALNPKKKDQGRR